MRSLNAANRASRLTISPKTLKMMLTGQADVEGIANAINYPDLGGCF